MKTLTYAARIIMRMKAYSIICILGLVISLAGTMTLVRYIHQELTVDHYLKDLDRTYWLTCQILRGEGVLHMMDNSNMNRESHFVDPLDHPSVESYTSITLLPKGEITKDNYHFPVRAIAIDTTFFQLMPRESVIGMTDRLSPTGAILSEDFCKRLFGKEDPIGKELTFGGKNVTVSGIMKAPSTKVSFDFDIIVSEKLQRMWVGSGNARRVSLVRLHRAEDLETINAWQPEQKLIAFGKNEIKFQLFPLKNSYFNKQILCYGEEMFPKGDKSGIHILIFVAFLLFSIGTLNFLNLYMVIMQKRGLEFGIKKVFGAGHWQFFKQLYTENFLLSAITLLFVGMIIEVTDKILVSTLGIPIYNNIAFNTTLGVGMLFGFPLITMLYPYFRYTYNRPVSSIKGVNQRNNTLFSRSLFLMVQYVITFCLIVVSIYFAKQLYGMLNADLGFNTKNIIRCILIPAENSDHVIHNLKDWERKREQEKQKAGHIVHTLNACPDILAWTINAAWNASSDSYPLGKVAGTDGEFLEGNSSTLCISDFALFDLQIVEGRGWNETDEFSSYNLIINETAKKQWGITDIHTDMIQTKNRLWWDSKSDNSVNPPFHIVGVVKDFRTDHLSKAIQPMIYTYSPSSGNYFHPGSDFLVRYQPGKQQEVIKVLTKLRNEVSGEGEFSYTFLEDDIAQRYENEQRIVRIYLTFAALAIAVSCLGLFGLSLFEIRLRYREIALRKAHGAGVSDIVRLLLKRYSLLLGGSALIAFPLSVFFIHKYMEDYAYRTPLSGWIFLVALFIIATISAGVLFWQVHKAANINPATVMKRE